MEQNQIDNLKKYFFKLIDDWVEETLDNIINQKPVNRGIWDRFKGGVANLFYGRDNKNNPYYNLNRFGDALGSQANKESGREEAKKEHIAQRISLKNYLEIKKCVESTEFFLNEALDSSTENLQIVKSIRLAAQNLKQKLSNVIDSILTPKAPAEPSPAEPSPAEPSPAEPSPAEPSPSEPASAEPSPSEPAAAEPSPSEPASAEKPSTESDDSVEKRTIKWFEDAIEAKEKNNIDALRPKTNWLRKGTVVKHRIPWVIAWMSLRPHANPLDEESIKNELNRPDILNGAVKSVLPTIAPKGPNALSNYMRKWFVSNEENEERVNSQFNVLVSKLTRQTGTLDADEEAKSEAEAKAKSEAEAKAKSEAEAKAKSEAEAKAKSEAEAKSKARAISMKDFDRLAKKKEEKEKEKEKEKEEKISKSEEELKNQKIESALRFLSEGESKEKIIKKIQNKLIMPLFKSLSLEEDKDKLTGWWRSFINSMESNVQTIESIRAIINSGTLIEKILNDSGDWLKNKKITRSTIEEILLAIYNNSTKA